MGRKHIAGCENVFVSEHELHQVNLSKILQSLSLTDFQLEILKFETHFTIMKCDCVKNVDYLRAQKLLSTRISYQFIQLASTFHTFWLRHEH